MAAIHLNEDVEENSADESDSGRRHSGAKDFLQLCKNSDNDGHDRENPDTLPWPRYYDAMAPVNANQLLHWPSKDDVDDTNLLSPAIYGEEFQRSPAYHRNVNAILKGLLPFLTIDSIRDVLATYRQFAATFFVLDDGLQRIYERFGVPDHRALRSLAQKKVGSLQFSIQFRSRLPVSDNGNLRAQSHDIVLISARGERRRRTTKSVDLLQLMRLARDPELDENLRFELEWLAYHMATPRMQHHAVDDPSGKRSQSLRAEIPFNNKPHAGWLRAFCFGRIETARGHQPDPTFIQCLACLAVGRMTKISRNESRLHHINAHMLQFHEDIHSQVKLTEAVWEDYLKSLELGIPFQI